jgi:hypothetical protein
MSNLGVTHSQVVSDPFQQFLIQLSHRVKVMRFGVSIEPGQDAWGRIIGMFAFDHPVSIEDWLNRRGAEELTDDFEL